METEPGAALDNMAALRAIVEPYRVRMLGLLLAGPMAMEELAASLELCSADVSHHVMLLLEAGLIRQHSETGRALYAAQVGRLHEIARSLSGAEKSADITRMMADGAGGSSNDYEAKVLRAFLNGGRLVTIPAQEKKKDVLLRYLVGQCFLEGRDYTEKEVNELLRPYHEDVASLRRYMVVGGLLSREAGVYRRQQQEGVLPGAAG